MGSDQDVPSNSPLIGSDEWVAQVEGRVKRREGFFGSIANGWERLPAAARYGLVSLLLLVLPLISGTQPVLDTFGITNNDAILRIGARFLVFAILAIGLNVVVGYAGLLDLGYVAFYGIAGYLYAYLSSDFVQIGAVVPNGLATPSWLSVPLIMGITASIGYLLGSVSLRLTGDYLAIVTLGFGQVFVLLARTATRVQLPWVDHTIDFTRGPNGINRLDNISLFGYNFESTLQYYYLFFALLIIVFVVVNHLNQSRIGRAWRAMREDELAAEVMGMPTRSLKLLAFALGAGIAALAGAVDAAWQTNVVPEPRYSVLTLINLYAMVVLGGTGSLPGVVIGAFIFTVLPEALRNVEFAGILFYSAALIGLYSWLKPWQRFAAVFGGTIIVGYVLKFIAGWLWPSLDSACRTLASPCPTPGSALNQIVQGWLIIPENFQIVGNVVTILAVFVLLVTLLVKRPLYRWLLAGLVIYMFAFAWETRLAVEPAATRILVVGASLVVLMIVRPQGLLGNAEVRVV
jgi:branched-chain amino acid transport system permease protein